MDSAATAALVGSLAVAMGDLQRTEAQGGSPKLPEGLATGGVWAVLAKGAALASSLAVNALLARLLSPEEAGEVLFKAQGLLARFLCLLLVAVSHCR